MKWKEWPYWLKGGIFGLLIGVSWFVAGISWLATCYTDSGIPKVLALCHNKLLMNISTFPLNQYSIYQLIGSFLLFPMVGIALGLILKRFRKSNN